MSWIWIKEDDYCPKFQMVEFKRTYNLTGSAKLNICADTRYELYINNKFIGRGPASPGGDYEKTELIYSYYDVYEIKDAGSVEIRVNVTSCPTAMNEYTFGYAGLFLELYDNDTLIGKSDKSWQVRALTQRLSFNKSDYTLKENLYTSPYFIKNVHKLLKSPLEHLVEEKIIPSDFKVLTIKRGETVKVKLSLDKIYSAYTCISIKCNGLVRAIINTRELENIGFNSEEISTDKNIFHMSQRMYSIGECEIIIENISSDVAVIDDFHILYSHYPIKNEAGFVCSDRLLNDIYNVCMHTLKICRQSTHLDSPTHQEPLACTGDYYIQALMEHLNIYDPTLSAFDIFRTAQILECQNGRMFHTTYSLMFPMWLYDYYIFTGDKELIKKTKNALECLFLCFDGYIDNENGLLEYAPNYMFVDWIVMKDSPDPYGDARDMMSHGKIDGFSLHHPPKALGQGVLCMLYYQALICARELYLLLNDKKRADECLKKAQKIKNAINTHLYDENKGLYIGGLNTKNKVEENNWLPKNVKRVFYLKQANVLAVLFDIAPRKQKSSILDFVVNDLRKEEMQPYFYHFLLEAVLKEGMFQKYGLKLIKFYESLLQKCNKGLCEAWEFVKGDCSHAWGGAPAYILKKALAGLEMVEPNYKRIKLRPCLYSLDFANFAISTPYGNIEIDMEKGKEPIIKAPDEIEII